MPSFSQVALCAGFALVAYGAIGFALAIRVVPRPLAWCLAPAVGWAVHSVLALPVLAIVGMSRLAVIVVFGASFAIALVSLRRKQPAGSFAVPPAAALQIICALLLAAVVMAGVLPKPSSGGISLAAPIFDHSKVAMIDEMARLGVPPGNPFFGATGGPQSLTYYYLWHFSAAGLSVLSGANGWAADAALTWFTAFASLIALCGLASWIGGRASAGFWVIGLAATASMRAPLNWLFGLRTVEDVAGYQSGFGGWLFQTSWAPHHVASALCALCAIVLLVQLARRPNAMTAMVLAVVMAASFQSSTWVGGVVLPLVAAPLAVMLFARADLGARRAFLFHVAGSGLLALVLVAPFLIEQIKFAMLRDRASLAVMPVRVLGEGITSVVGPVPNAAAYWLIYLLVEFPAFYIAGLISLWLMLRERKAGDAAGNTIVALAVMLAVSLVAAWLFVSTPGENNDLGWRAVLPAVFALMVFAAAGFARLAERRAYRALAAGAVLIALGLPDGIYLMRENVVVPENPAAKLFADSPALWGAVRREAKPEERVANNPSYLEHLTPWGANISWALLSNRRSCDAGASFLGPLTTLSNAEQDRVSERFARVFAGQPDSGDLAALRTTYNCAVAVITPQDGAWLRDPFAASQDYRLVAATSQWRIYRAAASSS